MSLPTIDGDLDLDAWHLPCTLVYAFGRVAVCFSFMEGAIDRLIAALLDVPKDTGQAVTSALWSMGKRIELGRTLVLQRVTDRDLAAKIAADLSAAQRASKQRNIVTHNAITEFTFSADPSGHAIAFRKRDNLIKSRKAVAYDVRKLVALAKGLNDVAASLNKDAAKLVAARK